jgi:hypothetical protein
MRGLKDYATVGSLCVEHRKRTTIGVELTAKVSPFVTCPTPTGNY